MSFELRLQALITQHTQLDDAISAECGRPAPDTGLLFHLKRRKLQIKDEMVELRVAETA